MIKKIIANICFVGILAQSGFATTHDIKLPIDAPGREKIDPIQVIYDGHSTACDAEGMVTFPHQENREKFHLLVIKSIKFNYSDVNTIAQLQVSSDLPYLYYQLRKRIDPKNPGWDIKPKTLKKRQHAVPETCIVVLLDPHRVKEIQNWTFQLNEEKFIALPRIVLKPESEMEQLQVVEADKPKGRNSQMALINPRKPKTDLQRDSAHSFFEAFMHHPVTERVNLSKKVVNNNKKGCIADVTLAH